MIQCKSVIFWGSVSSTKIFLWCPKSDGRELRQSEGIEFKIDGVTLRTRKVHFGFWRHCLPISSHVDTVRRTQMRKVARVGGGRLHANFWQLCARRMMLHASAVPLFD